jgi:hypothetical protein
VHRTEAGFVYNGMVSDSAGIATVHDGTAGPPLGGGLSTGSLRKLC